MLDLWELIAPDEYTPGTFEYEMQEYLKGNR